VAEEFPDTLRLVCSEPKRDATADVVSDEVTLVDSKSVEQAVERLLLGADRPVESLGEVAGSESDEIWDDYPVLIGGSWRDASPEEPPVGIPWRKTTGSPVPRSKCACSTAWPSTSTVAVSWAVHHPSRVVRSPAVTAYSRSAMMFFWISEVPS
jgi:hypothetical protein